MPVQLGGILPILVRPGAIHAERIRAHVGSLVADAVYCSLPLVLRGETVADRVWLVAPMNRTGSGQLNGELLTPGNLICSPHERKDRSYLRGLRQEMAVPERDTRRPLRSVRHVGAASPLRLL